MWISRGRLERMETELSRLQMKVSELECCVFVKADEYLGIPSERTYRNSVPLRQIVYALAKKVGVKIRVTGGGSADVHLLSEQSSEQ